MMFSLNSSLECSRISIPKWSQRLMLKNSMLPSVMLFADRVIIHAPVGQAPQPFLTVEA